MPATVTKLPPHDPCTENGPQVRPGYTPRRPQNSTLYRIVQQHANTLFAEAEASSDSGGGYPLYVKREFERYLSCGQICRGFARIKCGSCGHEQILPYSCKGRSLCPSCIARRMADTAAHLVDNVMPVAPYRQWTLSLPRKIRLLVIRNPKLLTRVLALFLRAIFTYQRRRARKQSVKKPMTGAVTPLQFWGSILQLTPHAHSWVPDGVFHLDAQGELQFHRLPPPTDQDVKDLLKVIEARVIKACAEFDETLPDDDALSIAAAQHQAARPPLFTIPLADEEIHRPLCAQRNGFSLHANLDVHEKDRKKLERLLRYGLRPPFAQKRLSLLHDGRVRLKLRKPFYTGQTDIVFKPVDFLRRLAAAIPRPRQNMIRFHGIFAPNAKNRPGLKALMPPLPEQKPAPDEDKADAGSTTAPPAPDRRRRWAELLRRIFTHDALACPKWQGRMKVVQFVDDPLVISKICDHLGLHTSLPPMAPARASPQDLFDLEPP